MTCCRNELSIRSSPCYNNTNTMATSSSPSSPWLIPHASDTQIQMPTSDSDGSSRSSSIAPWKVPSDCTIRHLHGRRKEEEEEDHRDTDGRHTPAADQVNDDVGRMLDAVSNSSRFSFKEGFYSESEADLGRHRMEYADAEAYHRKEDFPHMRHLVALGAGRPYKQRTSTPRATFVSSSDTSQTQPEMLSAMSVPSVLPSSSQRDGPTPSSTPPAARSTTPAIVVHTGDVKLEMEANKKGSEGVRFFVGGGPIGTSPVRSPPKPSIMKTITVSPNSRGVTASVGSGHVKFSMGSMSSLEEGGSSNTSMGGDQQGSGASPSGKASGMRPSSRSSSRPRHKHSVPSQADLAKRRYLGSESEVTGAVSAAGQLVVFEDDVSLPEADLVELCTHRFGKVSGGGKKQKKRHLGVHNAMARIVQIGKPGDAVKAKGKAGGRWQDKFDHRPHDMFVELDELIVDAEDRSEWREKSRWIKFEEDAEEGTDRWGKPHVASLSFHSLLELRRVIEHGQIILDLEQEDLPSIAGYMVAELVSDKQLTPEQSQRLLKDLLLRHRHVNEKSGTMRRNISHDNLSSLDVANSADNASYKRSAESHSLSKALSTSGLRGWFTRRSSHHAAHQDKGEETVLNVTEVSKAGSSLTDGKAVSASAQANMKNEERHLDLKIAMSTESLMDRERKKETENGTWEDAAKVKKDAVKIKLENYWASSFQKEEEAIESEMLDDLSHISTSTAKASAGELGLHASSSATIMTREASNSSHHNRSNILNRIPQGAEATTVLVGSVNYLDKPVMAFVRLSQGQYLGQLTEVKLPVRFLILLMGPAVMDYHEVGRSISTLMSNAHFHDMAYRADGRGDLLHAINDFLDNSLVLPPGELGRNTLEPIIAMARKKAQQMKVTEAAAKESEKGLLATSPGGDDGPDGGDTGGDPLKRTGRPFGGLVQDIKRRYPFYRSDIVDALTMQCFAAVIFIFFACLSPAITFGGLLGEKTKNCLGVSEVMLATSVCGTTFGLLSGQPLNIIGVTGPILVFEEALFQICEMLSLEFLAFHCWVAWWVSVITLVMVALDGSFLISYITRFTEEIFATLISLIYIYEVFKKLFMVFQQHPLMKNYYPDDYIPMLSLYDHPNITFNHTILDVLNFYNLKPPPAAGWSSNGTDTNSTAPEPPSMDVVGQPNTALLTLILTFGTFFLAFFLRKFRNSKFLGRSARRALGDFGMPLSIVVMVLVDFSIADTYTEKLQVPDGLKPTNVTLRSWLVNPMGQADTPLPVWACFAAAIPACLVFILIFMESQITSIIVNKKDRNLQKGAGYHLDLLLIGGVFPVMCGLLGLPLLCAATIRSVAHVSALSVFSRTHAPGDKPHLVSVREQRVTNVLVHLLIGVSVLMGPLLRLIPLAVLFGLFLYMGVASMSGIHLFERVELMLMPVKHHPDAPYVRRVPAWKMNLFTVLQLLALAVLWAIKSTAVALAFPFVLILLVPVRRHLFKYIFTKQELIALDTLDDDAEDDELDFYQQAHR